MVFFLSDGLGTGLGCPCGGICALLMEEEGREEIVLVAFLSFLPL